MPQGDHLTKVKADATKQPAPNSDSHSKCRGDGKHVLTATIAEHLTAVKGDNAPPKAAVSLGPVVTPPPPRKRKARELGASDDIATSAVVGDHSAKPKPKAKKKK